MDNLFNLLRIKQWVKNLFVLTPLFFAGALFNSEKLLLGIAASIMFSLMASSIYIVNDILDKDKDAIHPTKSKRPIASGTISIRLAVIISIVLTVISLSISINLKPKLAFILALYYILNILYCFWLKHISILDVVIIAVGFVLRVKAGGIITDIHVSAWLTLMVFLLALFIAFAKRRDDVLINIETGKSLRKSIKGYNLDLITSAMTLIVSTSFVCYLMYTLSPTTTNYFNTHRLYYTGLFVLIGILRYLQIIYLENDSGSPTKVLYKDKFLIVTLICWLLSFLVIIYLPEISFF